MALDLFANFERSSNGNVFYRNTSTSPFSVTVYLSDANISGFNYASIYEARISLNGAPLSPFPVSGGVFRTNYNFVRNVESTYVINVEVVSTIASPPTVVGNYVLSAVFLDDIPIANFNLYPKYQPEIDPFTGNPILRILDSSNAFVQSSGTSFYGEGHTEQFYLSASNNTSSVSALWFVGNDIVDILSDSNSKSPSLWPVVPDVFLNSSTVNISTVLNQEVVYPVSLFYTSTKILSTSPVITYNDVTGIPEYYPYFLSTQNINREDFPTNNRLRDSIRVVPYPDFTPINFISPFSGPDTTLPLTLESQNFLAYIIVPTSPTVLTEEFIGTQWSIKATSDGGDWGGPDDALTNTVLLTSIYAYSFQLGYDNIKNNILDYFKTSPTSPTTVTVQTSSQKIIQIIFPGNPLSPNDWLPKTVYQSNQASTIVNALPYAKVYTRNYFNLKNTPVQFDIVSKEIGIFKLKRLWITSNKSLDSIALTETSPLSGTLNFNQIGLANLTITIVIESNIDSTCASNQQTNAEYIVSTTYENFIEIVEQYDQIDTKHYLTNLTNLDLPYTQEPLLTPNEWVIEDNINDSIKKLNDTIQTIDQFTKIYEKKTCLYGWAGLKQAIEGDSSYVWQDLECPPSFQTFSSWSKFECDITIPPIPINQWQFHECDESLADPTGLGKYCVYWKWRQRTRAEATEPITWRDTTSVGLYAKKWRFERCESDALNLNCDRSGWKISSIDQEYFPFAFCDTVNRCKFADVEHFDPADQLIIAYPTEIQLADLDYNFTYITRQGKADELFPFQNIVGIDSGTNNELFVLDSVLNKVCLFELKDKQFKLFTSWGRFGFRDNKNGFNKPSDIHVDLNNNVWIADTGNKCVKNYTFNGKHIKTIIHESFEKNPPLSMCIDSTDMLHVLLRDKVVVFDYIGNFKFQYDLDKYVSLPRKINTSYNREMIYVVYDTGVIKYFRTGTIGYYIVHEHECDADTVLKGFTSITQDRNRNLYVVVGDKILKVPDLMKLIELKASISDELYWSTDELLIHKEEYIQPWVYLKSIHRLWDNIELLRSSLFYDAVGCKSPTNPIYEKEDLVIGNNEIVSNAVWNRLFTYLWENLQTMFKHFDPKCEPEPTSRKPLIQCSQGFTSAEPPQSRFLTNQLPLPYRTINGPRVVATTEGLTLSVSGGIEIDSVYYYPTVLLGGSYNQVTILKNCEVKSVINYDSSREGTIFGYSFDKTTIPQITARFVNGDVINIKAI